MPLSYLLTRSSLLHKIGMPSSLLAKKGLLVLLAKKMLDLVAQAFLLQLWLLFFLSRGSTVASVFLLVDVAFAAALVAVVSQSD
jgi:hypothetical protein